MEQLRRFSYEIKFHRVDGETEYFIHNTLQEAKEHYDMFDSRDSDMYSEIALLEYDHEMHKERFITFKTL